MSPLSVPPSHLYAVPLPTHTTHQKYCSRLRAPRHLSFFIKVLMRSVARSTGLWFFQFVWAAPPPPPHLPRWPGAVWSWLVRGPWLAGKVFVCGCCLLLMLFDILAGVLSARLSRCRGRSDILKGSSVWATVNFCCFLPLSLLVSLAAFLIIRIKTRVAGIW